MKDNIINVIKQLVIFYRLKINFSSIEKKILSHPNYPFLKSVCDALNEWKIKNSPRKVELNDVVSLKAPFLIHLNIHTGLIAFVKEIRFNKIIYTLGSKKYYKEDIDQFIKKTSGVVILLYPDKNSGENNYYTIRQKIVFNRIIPLLLLLASIILLFIKSNHSLTTILNTMNDHIVYLSVSVIGLITCFSLILLEYHVGNRLLNKICNIHPKIRCGSIIDSNASKIFSIVTWADIGFIYFLTTVTFILSSESKQLYGILSLLSSLTIPFVIYSLYYQLYKIKSICPLCLIVQIVLIADFVILLPYFSTSSVTIAGSMTFVIAFSIVFSLYFIFKDLQMLTNEIKINDVELLKFKRNSKIFISQLFLNEPKKIEKCKLDIVFGPQNAQIMVTAFLSLNCKPCSVTFSKLAKIISNHNISLRLILMTSKSGIKELCYIFENYSNKSKEKAWDLMEKWYAFISNGIKNPFNHNLNFHDNKALEELVHENIALFSKYMISETPTLLINGYIFPKQFDIADLDFFMDDVVNHIKVV